MAVEKSAWYFYAPHNEKLQLGAAKLQPEVRASTTGQIIESARVIHFEAHLFQTTSKREADYIRESEPFKEGRIIEINKAELQSVGIRHRRQMEGELASQQEERANAEKALASAGGAQE